MTDYSTLVQRLRGEHGTEPWQINPAAKIAADAIEAQAKRIEELEAALNDAMEELRHAYIMGFTERYRDAARAACKVLGEKE